MKRDKTVGKAAAVGLTLTGVASALVLTFGGASATAAEGVAVTEPSTTEIILVQTDTALVDLAALDGPTETDQSADHAGENEASDNEASDNDEYDVDDDAGTDAYDNDADDETDADADDEDADDETDDVR